MGSKARELLRPKNMVQTTGGYAELQPAADAEAALPECGVDCERERAAGKNRSPEPRAVARLAGRRGARKRPI